MGTGVAGTSQFIRSVTYHLNPTFKKPVIKVTQPPFILSRDSWGDFELKIVVEF